MAKGKKNISLNKKKSTQKAKWKPLTFIKIRENNHRDLFDIKWPCFFWKERVNKINYIPTHCCPSLMVICLASFSCLISCHLLSWSSCLTSLFISPNTSFLKQRLSWNWYSPLPSFICFFFCLCPVFLFVSLYLKVLAIRHFQFSLVRMKYFLDFGSISTALLERD